MLIQLIEIIADVPQELHLLAVIIQARQEEQQVQAEQAAENDAQLGNERLDGIRQYLCGQLQIDGREPFRHFLENLQHFKSHEREKAADYIYISREE